MLRDETLEEISDGRRYHANDMVKADSHGCEGCHLCCTGMGDSVVLDPLDVHRLATGLSRSVSDLLEKELVLGVTDGNILPHLAMAGKEEACVFLNAQGRCSVHPHRPGFCRMFPLGRYYEDRKFSYILQVHECPSKKRSKIKVSKWLDTPELRTYEDFVLSWHNLLLDVREVLNHTENQDLVRNLNLYVLNRFYLKPYEEEFYTDFQRRLQEARDLLALNGD